MHLLHHRRIAWEAAGIELLHLSRQLLHFFRGLRIALYHLPELVQFAHSLLIGALRIGGIAGRVRRRRPLLGLAIATVTGIDVAPDRAIGTAATAGAHVTALATALARAISRLLAEAAALLWPALCILARLQPGTTLLAPIARLLSVAPGLPLLIAILPELIVLALLFIATLLPALAALALLPTVTTARRGHRLKLAAQPFHLAQRGCLITLCRTTLSRFALAHSLLRLPKLLTQLLQPLRNLILGSIRVRIDSAAQPIGCPLNMIVKVGLVHLRQRIAQLLRNTRLSRRHLARGIPNAFLQL
jgi:hypothetical protein